MVNLTRRGFTFIEVLSTLLVVTVGLVGVVGLISYGNRLSAKALGETIAMATAVSVACDPQPRLDPTVAADWSYAPIDFDNADSIQKKDATGMINGMYVRRTETTTPEDIIARNPVTALVHARSVLVEVSVSETIGGAVVASYVTRFVRQRRAP